MDNKYVRGAAKLKTRIATIRSSIDLPGIESDIGQLLLQRTLRRFDRQVDPNENKWIPLSKSGARSKAYRVGPEAPLLVRSGALRKAIALVRGGLGQLQLNTGAGMRVGIEDQQIAEYARLHNQGKGGMPLRKFLGIGALDVKAVDALMRRKAQELESL